jgi:hypothetical protein
MPSWRRTPTSRGSDRNIARQESDSTWTVAFGRIDPGSGAYLVAYEAHQVAARPDSFTVQAFPTPRSDTAFYGRAGRAIDRARASFPAVLGQLQRPYNMAILPTADGSWRVYAFPAPVQHAVWPLGADVRFRITADGGTVLATRKLHNAIIDFGPVQAGQEPAAGSHRAVFDDIPEDTDVMHVLRRTPHVPQLIATDSFAFVVNADGSIRFYGRREDITGR